MAFTDIGSEEDIVSPVTGTNIVTVSVAVPNLDAESVGWVAV